MQNEGQRKWPYRYTHMPVSIDFTLWNYVQRTVKTWISPTCRFAWTRIFIIIIINSFFGGVGGWVGVLGSTVIQF